MFQLRYLQTLNSISAENNSTVIFPVPIDIMNQLMTGLNNNRQQHSLPPFYPQQQLMQQQQQQIPAPPPSSGFQPRPSLKKTAAPAPVHQHQQQHHQQQQQQRVGQRASTKRSIRKAKVSRAMLKCCEEENNVNWTKSAKCYNCKEKVVNLQFMAKGVKTSCHKEKLLLCWQLRWD